MSWPAKHNLSHSSTYRSWAAMKTRCTNPNAKDYAAYGAQGISVCERWLSFENFLADMGLRPVGTSLDRYPDQRGNYEPGNCRWATQKQQRRNVSSNTLLEHDGKTACIAEWAESIGVHRDVVIKRLARGWSVERALTTEKRSHHRVR